MPYVKNTWIDEVLAGDVRYNILEDGGGAFKSTMRINLGTTVTQAGTVLNAARMNNIEGELQILSDALLYKLAVSVSANDLVVTLQHSDGTNPTSTRPLYFRIDGVWRAVTTTTTITVVDGSSWFNSGSVEFGTQLVGYFPYVVWDSNSSVVALSIARIPYGRSVSEFNSSATSEKHLIGYANFTSTDPVANIGYFEATLSLAGTGHLWTVPTFTNANLKPEPTFETRTLTYAPVWTSTGTQPAIGDGTQAAHYKVRGREVIARARITAGSTSTYGTGTYTWALPFTAATFTGGSFAGVGRVFDSSVTTTYVGYVNIGSAGTVMNMTTHAATGAVSGTVPVTMATSDQITINAEYAIA